MKRLVVLLALQSKHSMLIRNSHSCLRVFINKKESRGNSIKMFDAARACGIIDTSSKMAQFSTNSSTTNSFATKIALSPTSPTPSTSTAGGCTIQTINGNCSRSSSYKAAVGALKTLQSNAITLQQSIEKQENNLGDTIKYLERSGLKLSDLDKISMIHVSGTKGKGSTCALTESILRSFGINTGFFSSPHLISVTERFRLNGKPISETDWAEYFWKVYNRLDERKEHEKDMPPYFKFLTILCFHIFIERKVDVGIIEVGVGGLKDCTNILRNTKTIGITSLGLDHTRLLGNTLEEIAYQKAGIIKPNSNVFTVPQPKGCLSVIENEARKNNARIFTVPDYSEYSFKKNPQLQIASDVQKLNASLAIQLAYDWLNRHAVTHLNGFTGKNPNEMTAEVPEQVIHGLETCFWPGRCQIVQFHKMRIHLDGAHTLESLDVCKIWFMQSIENRKNTPKFLIFNSTGERNPKIMLDILSEGKVFDLALFTPNIPFNNLKRLDNDTPAHDKSYQLNRCSEQLEHWLAHNAENKGKKFDCIVDSLLFLHQQFQEIEIDILVTGSIHLIGATLLALEETDKRFPKN